MGLVLPVLAGMSGGSSSQPIPTQSLPEASETVAKELIGGLARALPDLVQQLPSLAKTLGPLTVWDLLSNDALRPFLNGFSKQVGVGVADLLTGRFKPQTKAPSSLTVQVRNELKASLAIQLALQFEQAACPQRSPAELAQLLADQLADTISPALADSLLKAASINDIRTAIGDRIHAVVDQAGAALSTQLDQNQVTLAPALTVAPREGPPGTLVTIEGTGPEPSGLVHLVFEGTQPANMGRAELGDALVDGTGHFRLKAKIPTILRTGNGSVGDRTRAGVYSITAWPTRCASSYTVARFAVPFTG